MVAFQRQSSFTYLRIEKRNLYKIEETEKIQIKKRYYCVAAKTNRSLI